MLMINIAVHLSGKEAVKAIIGVITICAGAALTAYKISLDKGCLLKTEHFVVEPV